MSRTRSENARASGVPSSSPYSFIAAPQPAALTTTWSSGPSAANAATVARARASAASSSPACSSSAPQQSGARGAIDVEPLGRQRRDRRAVDARVEDALHATEQHSDAAAPRAHGRGVHRRCRREQITQRRPRGDLREHRDLVRKPLDAELARRRHARDQRAHPARIGKRREQQPAQRALAARALVVALDLGPDALDQPVVANPRRARGHARHAAEAAVEMRDDLGR